MHSVNVNTWTQSQIKHTTLSTAHLITAHTWRKHTIAQFTHKNHSMLCDSSGWLKQGKRGSLFSEKRRNKRKTLPFLSAEKPNMMISHRIFTFTQCNSPATHYSSSVTHIHILQCVFVQVGGKYRQGPFLKDLCRCLTILHTNPYIHSPE